MLQMDELKCRKRVLRRMGYCSADDVIEMKGRVACELSRYVVGYAVVGYIAVQAVLLDVTSLESTKTCTVQRQTYLGPERHFSICEIGSCLGYTTNPRKEE